MIYLDNAATTYPKPEPVYKALDYANRLLSFNAGRGESKESLSAFKCIDECRKIVSEVAGVFKEKVVFTDSATMASNIIISGLDLLDGDIVYVSPFEHNAVCRALNIYKDKGVEVEILKFDFKTLRPDLDSIKNQFARKKPRAVFVSEVSNVTGTIIDFMSIFEISKKYDCVNVLDSSQAFGLVKADDYSQVDYQIFAGHKTLYASFGIGGFIVRNNDSLKVSFAGGTGSDSLNLSMPSSLPSKYEFGSPNVVASYGLLAAIEWLKGNDVVEKVRSLTDYLYQRICEVEKAIVYGGEAEHIAILSFNIEGFNPSDVGRILSDEYNISVRTGYHCAPFIHNLLGTIDYGGTVRVSLGFFNTKEDIDVLIDALKTL